MVLRVLRKGREGVTYLFHSSRLASHNEEQNCSE